MNDIEQLVNRWTSFTETDLQEFCKLLSSPDDFDNKYTDLVSGIDAEGNKSFDFRGLKISNQSIRGGFFVGIDLSHATFENCVIKKSAFDYSDIIGCRFVNCIFETVGFWNCDLSDCMFESVLIEDGRMNTLPSKNCKLINSVFKDSNFCGNDMSTWVFEGVLGYGNELYDSVLPLSQQTQSWWEMTPADRIRWI